MIAWQRATPFCQYLRNRERRRQRLAMLAYSNAKGNDTALKLAAKLAKSLRVDIGSVK